VSDAERAVERVAALRGLRRYAEAEREARAALAADPQDAALLAGLAAVLYDAGRYRAALAAAEASVAAAPEWAWPHRLRALALSGQTRHRMARPSARRAVELAPSDPDAALTLSWVLSAAGDRSDAFAAARRAVELGPELPRTQRRLADSHVALGNRRAARRHYREALRLDPDDADALRGLAEIAVGRLEPGDPEAAPAMASVLTTTMLVAVFAPLPAAIVAGTINGYSHAWAGRAGAMVILGPAALLVWRILGPLTIADRRVLRAVFRRFIMLLSLPAASLLVYVLGAIAALVTGDMIYLLYLLFVMFPAMFGSLLVIQEIGPRDMRTKR